MARYAFDIETNGLLDTMDTIHSLVLTDLDDGDVLSWTPGDIQTGVEVLMKADLIVGHNIIKFDIPAIQKIYPWFQIDENKVYDTLVMSRLIWADLMDRDAKAVAIYQNSGGTKGLPPKMRGRHSLEAWGYRLGHWKGDYSEEMKAKGLDPWASWNEDMQRYCEQDVVVTVAFWELIQSKKTDPLHR